MIFTVLYIIDFEVDKPTNFCVPDCIAYNFKTKYCDQISTPPPSSYSSTNERSLKTLILVSMSLYSIVFIPIKLPLGLPVKKAHHCDAVRHRVSLMLLPHLHGICDQLLNRRVVKCNLFVLHDIKAEYDDII